jgi:predicted ATP-grasp superfamily ATP-dependent carboligase
VTHVLIAGVSTRAFAESAARAGFAVTTIDAFADVDHPAGVRRVSLSVSFSPRAAAHASRGIECDVVTYASNFENHPRAVRELVAGRVLWGNTVETLHRVRDPLMLTQALRRRGIVAPAVQQPPRATVVSATHADVIEEGVHRDDWSAVRRALPSQREPDRWLVKPIASGGGHRVRPWQSSALVPRGHYVQQFVEGTPGSVVFVAADRCVVMLGLSRQLIGEPAFGATHFQYCGNILAGAADAQFALDATLVHAASALAAGVADEFALVGVNGIDFVACNGVPYPVEVNPRWSASMELVERAYGLSVFGMHAAACDVGRLPEFDLLRARRGTTAFGKAVVFARRDVIVGDTREWLRAAEVAALPSIRDIPHPGERIAAGRPICTVFAESGDAAACHAALVKRAESVYATVDAWST